VSKGEPLFTAVAEGHARDLEARTLELDVARVELEAARAARASASEKLRIYEGIARHKQRIAKERVQALTIESESEEKHLARIESMVRDGLERGAALDEAKASSAKVKGELNTALAELDLANDAVRAADPGSFYDGFRLVGEL